VDIFGGDTVVGSGETVMENAGGEKKQAAGTSSVAWAMWDPFWLMRGMLGWGRAAGAPLFDVTETDDTYVCKVNVKLTLPDQADAAHVKAELDDGQLTLVVPKTTAATPQPQREPQTKPERKSVSSPPKARRRTGNDRRGSARRRGTRTPASRR
jgi:hypothetical protein